jgi:hypothetical protein
VARDSKSDGFVLIDRRFFRREWTVGRSGRPFSRQEAWIDLIQMADYGNDDGRVPGRVVASSRYLSKRWNWARSRVQRQLSRWIEDGRIERSKSGPPNGATYRAGDGAAYLLVNYTTYQRKRAGSGAGKRATTRAEAKQVTTKQVTTKQEKDALEQVELPRSLLAHPNYRQTLEAWLDYKATHPNPKHRLRYSTKGLQMLVTKQSEVGPETAIEAMELAMANGWSGCIYFDSARRARQDRDDVRALRTGWEHQQ